MVPDAGAVKFFLAFGQTTKRTGMAFGWETLENELIHPGLFDENRMYSFYV